MIMDKLAKRGVCLIGCGFMGKALVEAWLAKGMPASSIYVRDPRPSGWLQSQAGVNINEPFPASPAAIVIATRPQIVEKVLAPLGSFGGGETVILSIAASKPISMLEKQFPDGTPIIRAMPNLPATVGSAVSTFVANEALTASQKVEALKLIAAFGSVVELPDEGLLPVVTALSGAGPAYVFAMAEAFAAAGARLGLPEDLAHELAVRTVAGAGRMLAQPDADATGFRVAVTSKGGTTEAGMLEFMADENGIQDLARRTVEAAAERCKELSGLKPAEQPRTLRLVRD
ncbi:pyrroline-5-carboxylate reductase [Roseibium sp.]|uniref:pyrroline-5-carboxylate reductase n=1 Tax=Roseibium sp. TaxID=1936156 RepID=UPI00351874B1